MATASEQTRSFTNLELGLLVSVAIWVMCMLIALFMRAITWYQKRLQLIQVANALHVPRHIERVRCSGCDMIEDTEWPPTNDGFQLHQECASCGWNALTPAEEGLTQDWIGVLRDQGELQHIPGKTNVMKVTPDVPLRKLYTNAEAITFVFSILSGLLNCFSVTYKLVGAPERNTEEHYNLSVLALLWLEFFLVIAFLLYILFRVINKAMTTRSAGACWFVIMIWLPRLSHANSLTLLQMWDVAGTLTKLIRALSSMGLCKGLMHHFWRIPMMIVIFIVPTLAIFIRMQQARRLVTVYISEWTTNDWITFLSLINNFRTVALVSFHHKPLYLEWWGFMAAKSKKPWQCAVLYSLGDYGAKGAFELAELNMKHGSLQGVGKPSDVWRERYMKELGKDKNSYEDEEIGQPTDDVQAVIQAGKIESVSSPVGGNNNDASEMPESV